MDRVPAWVDEWFITTWIIVFALVVVDFLMGATARSALRERVGYWWLVLDDISLEGIYQSVTRRTLTILQRIGGPRVLSIRFFGSSFLIFGSITICAVTICVFMGMDPGEYRFFSIHERVLVPHSQNALLTQFEIPMQLDRLVRLGPWEAIRGLTVAFLLPNILVGTLSLILTRFVFQAISKSRRFHMIALLTITNLVLSIALVAIPYFIGFLAYRIQFFHAVAARVVYDVPGLGGPKQLWSEMPLNLTTYMDWSVLQRDFTNTMLQVLYQEPLAREFGEFIVSHKDGSASLLVVLEPDNGYKPLDVYGDQDVALEGGFIQAFQIRTMAYVLFFLVSALSVLPVVVNVILAGVLGSLRSAESLLRPMSAFLLRRLYEDGRPVLSILAVIVGAMLKVVQELMKHFL